MNQEHSEEETPAAAPLPAAEFERLLGLLAATGEIHPDLERVLGEPQAERIVEEIIADEIQDQRA